MQLDIWNLHMYLEFSHTLASKFHKKRIHEAHEILPARIPAT